MVLSCHVIYPSTRRDILWLPSSSASAKVTRAVYFAKVSFLSYHNPNFMNVSSINTQNLYSSLSRLVCMLHNNCAWSHLELAFTGDSTSPSHASAIKDSLNPSRQVPSQVPIHSKEVLRKWICICDGDSKSPCTASVL